MKSELSSEYGEVDLHVHTKASDGVRSPAEVVELAKWAKLRAIGICDHDTLDGAPEAESKARELEMEVVPGVEINTQHEGREVHVLGYYIERDEEFCELLSILRRSREERLELIVERLAGLGIFVSPERVREIAGDAPVGRPHVGRAMMELGYVRSVEEAFEKYLDVGRPAYLPRYRITPFEAVKAIRRAKGIPVLAHPGTTGESELVKELAEVGLVGLEVYHPTHTPAQARYYRDMAIRLGLIVTGGSDYHGDDAGEGCELGGVRVPYSTVVLMRKAREKVRLDVYVPN